ncbi:hypothetical protein UFOVP760_72 [uncultured Caudovirales phage]|uniref:C2H2-type domain-containing protein n=1 Tax=uncultured Caudovirales phage TaxID=2100421 RepID=A0A6J7XBM0_9CAUD|nr:hypothetical protein UFOVP760_72 [uncultured Caudovirales phage]
MTECIYCKETFTNKKEYANHIRWRHKQGSKDMGKCNICNKHVSMYALPRHIKLCQSRIKVCPQCNKQFTGLTKKFCSSSCSATYNNKFKIRKPWSEEQKRKQSERVKMIRPRTIHSIACCICGKIFKREYTKRKTCGDVCFRRLLQINATVNPNCGGETNYKRYTYKGIIFDSSWEVKIAKHLDKKQIKWERSRKHVLYWVDSNKIERRYYPDFFLTEHNIYIDPKNSYKQEIDKEKLDYIKRYYTLIVGDVNECIELINRFIIV